MQSAKQSRLNLYNKAAAIVDVNKDGTTRDEWADAYMRAIDKEYKARVEYYQKHGTDPKKLSTNDLEMIIKHSQ